MRSIAPPRATRNMTEQEMRCAFFNETGKIATSSPNTYSAFCRGLMVEREELAKHFAKHGGRVLAGDEISHIIRKRSNA